MQNVAQFVERATRDLEEPRELVVGLAAEALGNVSSDGVGGILGLVLRFEVSSKSRLRGEAKYLNPYLLGQFPHDQLRIVVNG